MRWHAYYYLCNQVPCKGCSLCLDLPETLAFFFLDPPPVRRRLPLDCELLEDVDRGRLLTNGRKDWGVTCGPDTEGFGSKIERLPREEEDAVCTGSGLSGEEDWEGTAEWRDPWDSRESALRAPSSSSSCSGERDRATWRAPRRGLRTMSSSSSASSDELDCTSCSFNHVLKLLHNKPMHTWNTMT